MKTHYLQKRIAYRNVSCHLATRQHFLSLAREVREAIAKQSGDNGGVNRFPISGGICEHWDQWQKDAVIECVVAANEATDRALACHKRAGRRVSTFRALLVTGVT